MHARAEIEFDFDTNEEAERVLKALTPEISSSPDDRADVALESSGKKLLLKISSAERAPFRAAIGTYLRWIRIANEVGGI